MIGKKVGNNLYVHKSAVDYLTIDEISFIQSMLVYVPPDFNYHIIKFNLKEQKLTVIQSLDFDTASEPNVGDSILVYDNKQIKFRKSNNLQIYHHKWMFVNSNYTGFDITKSKNRSKYWKNIIKNLENTVRNVKCKIGYREYFNKFIIE